MTELDLRHSLIPDELVEELTKTMPEHAGIELQEDRDLPKYDYVKFMEGLIDARENHGANGRLSPTRNQSPVRRS